MLSIIIIDQGVFNLHITFFIGLGAQLINSCFEKELLILGMAELTEGHSAERIKESIENIVNKYNFDKSKVKGLKIIFFNIS